MGIGVLNVLEICLLSIARKQKHAFEQTFVVDVEIQKFLSKI
jgi:hypothetical protein